MFALLVSCIFVSIFHAVEAKYSQLLVHERRSDILSQQWTRLHQLDASTILPVRVELRQRNLQKGHQLLMNISDPQSSSYGKHLRAEDVVDLFAPKNKSITTATDWLTGSRIRHSRLSLSSNRQWIKFDARADELERLLSTKYHVYEHQVSFEQDIACEEYFVPSHVRAHIDYISPGIGLRSFKASGKLEQRGTTPDIMSLWERADDPSASNSTTGLNNCSQAFTPECIAAIYNISKATTGINGNEIGFYEGFNDIFNQKDFDLFTKTFYPRIPQGFAPTMLSVDGASINDTSIIDIDPNSALNTQAAMPIIYPQGFKIWQNSIQGQNGGIGKGWFNTWLDAIDGSYCHSEGNKTGNSPGIDNSYPNRKWPHREQCGVYKPTHVIAISYGASEASLPVAYVQRQCQEYMKLGLQGHSILVGTENYGIGSLGANGGTSNFCLGKENNIFAPAFPASCPYVTAVGATTYAFGANVHDHAEEEAVPLSGGGFSNVWPIQNYQKSSIETYFNRSAPRYKSYVALSGLTAVDKGWGQYNRNGRGIPDVAAIGHKFECAATSRVGLGSGTSISTAIWAALFNRINEERLQMYKSTVGFVNKALYANPDLMHDIQKGYNWNCDMKSVGFNTSKGWDPVTGLGSPSYPALLEYFKHL